MKRHKTHNIVAMVNAIKADVNTVTSPKKSTTVIRNIKQEILVEWKNGTVECVDSAENESEACHLVSEYRMAFGDSYKRIWMQLER